MSDVSTALHGLSPRDLQCYASACLQAYLSKKCRIQYGKNIEAGF